MVFLCNRLSKIRLGGSLGGLESPGEGSPRGLGSPRDSPVPGLQGEPPGLHGDKVRAHLTSGEWSRAS